MQPSKEKIIRDALESARDWFKSVHYNAYGIAVEDDASDPQEVLKEIENALQEVGRAGKGRRYR